MDEEKVIITPEIREVINKTYKECQDFSKKVREEHEKFIEDLRKNG